MVIICVALGVASSSWGQRRRPSGPPRAYRNDFLGLSVPLPAGWHRANKKEISAVVAKGEGFAGSDPKALDKVDGSFLLMATEHPLGRSRSTSSVVIIAMSTAGHEDEFSDPGGYLQDIVSDISRALPNARIDAQSTVSLGGETFDLLDVSYKVQGIAVHQRAIASVIRDHLVHIQVTASSAAELEKIWQTVRGARCTAPNLAQKDLGGVPLRETSGSGGAGLNVPALLKRGALALMIVGALAIVFGRFFVRKKK